MTQLSQPNEIETLKQKWTEELNVRQEIRWAEDVWGFLRLPGMISWIPWVGKNWPDPDKNSYCNFECQVWFNYIDYSLYFYIFHFNFMLDKMAAVVDGIGKGRA